MDLLYQRVGCILTATSGRGGGLLSDTCSVLQTALRESFLTHRLQQQAGPHFWPIDLGGTELMPTTMERKGVLNACVFA